MSVRVGRAGMRLRFAGMAVGVDVDRAVVMAVAVKMHAVVPETPEHVSAEPDQHDADRSLQRARDVFGDDKAEQQRCAGESEQRQRMAEPPGQAMAHDIADPAAPRRDARHRRDMIGLQRVLHPQQKPQPQNSEHLSPAGSTSSLRGAQRRSNPVSFLARRAGLLRFARNDGLNSFYDTHHRICQSKVRAGIQGPHSTSSKSPRIDAQERRSAFAL